MTTGLFVPGFAGQEVQQLLTTALVLGAVVSSPDSPGDGTRGHTGSDPPCAPAPAGQRLWPTPVSLSIVKNFLDDEGQHCHLSLFPHKDYATLRRRCYFWKNPSVGG